MNGTPECKAVSETYEGGMIICDLPQGHDGLHYDELHNVSWKEGLPG